MALPPLRQPKTFTIPENQLPTKTIAKTASERKQIIVTLKNGAKLVVTSDAYHSFLNEADKFLCVCCNVEIGTEGKIRELHKFSSYHNQRLGACPYVEEYKTNLVRQINSESYYCTTCNVVVKKVFIIRHLSSEVHRQELEKAKNKSLFYTSLNN